MLTMAGGEPAFTRFATASSPPKVVCVSEHEASWMFAAGAAALAYSTSMAASESSPFTPGSLQLFVPVEGGCTVFRVPAAYELSPKVERKVVQSAVEYKSVSSTTTI